MLKTHAYPVWLPQWLWLCAVMVVLMIGVGGVTRLTESGLSMVTWDPIRGIVPPISDSAWEEAFNAYKSTPEYIKINHGMSLSDFKGIYWWEFIHRVLGRITGMVYAVPVLWLWVMQRSSISSGLLRKLTVLPILVGLQGYMGWQMVKSGLIDNPDVSPYRLMLHLSLALIILAITVNINLSLSKVRYAKKMIVITIAYYALTVIFGALVAGLNAGLVYNTFPLMSGMLIPPEVFSDQFFFANPVAVQWIHRVFAFFMLLVTFLCGKRYGLWVPFALVCVQIFLGAVTVMYQVPIWSASLHQLNAAFILISLIFALYHRPLAKEA